ncbi:hypothetical protein SAMN05421743_12841 [Thalassobacillus cyri]|uniref:DUF1850 domain-containing protein n=1 Tax=Thalassobacillus cyri TaxID=571932 RepID=A0A1H4HGY6_9BACI|nr:DUF1850 domain-containing protein [Thalassobacillus cyri]SEB20680.1 hypothetical protein SAMN05421743_12841 [Thalassobacillus cyri]
MERFAQKRVVMAVMIGFIFLSAASLWLFYPYQYVLALHTKDTDKPSLFLPVEEGDRFQIKFTHSIHLSDVIEEYEVKDKKLIPVQLIYEDTAVGMPSNAGEGETFKAKDGKYYITGLKGEHKYIDLSVGQVKAKHTILFKDRSYLLKEYVGGGTIVRIQPLYINNWELLRGVNVHE